MQPEQKEQFKIVLTYRDVEGDIATETVWAEKIGANYKIKSIPFFAPNLAYNDLIAVESDQGELHFDDVIASSGHSTVQVVFFIKECLSSVGQDLMSLGCDWEGFKDAYISVDIPPSVNYLTVKAYLDLKFSEKVLDYKEACLAHKP